MNKTSRRAYGRPAVVWKELELSVPTVVEQLREEAGQLYRRCGCRGQDGKQFGFSCPTLKQDKQHGRWYFAVQVEGLEGKRERVRRGGYASEELARLALAEFRRLPTPEVLARMWTVRRFLEFWLEYLEENGLLRPSALLNYQRAVRSFLIPELGQYRLSKLRVKQVQRAIDRICRHRVRGGRLIAASTVSQIRAVLRSALSDARRRGLVGFNAAWRLKMPGGVRAHPVVWSRERESTWRETGVRPRVACWEIAHLARFLEQMQDDRLFALWWLVGLRGPRRGELAALRWRDLDFASAELTIREQIVVINGVEHLGPTKSAAGVRTLALDETTVKIMWAHWRAEQLRGGGVAPDPDDPIFTYVNGRQVKPDWLTRRFRKLCAQLDLPPVRLHDLRHGAISLAGAAGVSLKVMQHDAGHSSPVTTVEVYQHVFAETAHRSVAETANLLLSHAKLRLSLEGASLA